MFSFQTAGNPLNRRLFFNLFNFNKSNNAMICSNKWSFPMQQFKKVAPLQEQQFRMFRHSCLLQNSPSAASSMPSALDVDEAIATNEELLTENSGMIQEEQQLEETGKQETLNNPIQNETADLQKVISKRIYPIRETGKKLSVAYQMGKSGRKAMRFYLGYGPTTFHFPKIHVPEDVFGFVRAMDEVLETVHAKKSIIEAINKRQKRLILYTAKAKGVFYDFQLELCVFNNSVQVQMRTVPNEHKQEHNSRYEFISIHQLYWLRTAIGELFAENGEKNVQQQLGEPPSYPSWLNIDGTPHVLIKRNQLQQLQNIQFDQSQPLKRIDPQPAQPEMSSSWAAMSEQLLQLVFLQQQQLQQIQSAILKDQPMGGVGGAIAQKMGPDNTILMSDLLAQAPQSQTMPRWNRNNNNNGYRKNWSGGRYWDNQGYQTDDDY